MELQNSFYNKEFGGSGEDAANKYLKKNKYKIIQKNYKNKIGEIDIIAVDNDYLVFIEVKTRKSHEHGTGLEAVNYNKQKKIILVAESFLYTHREYDNCFCRFDVIEVFNEEITHIKDAFRK